MAGNKVNTKGKGKEEKSKLNKNTSQINEQSEDLDFSLLRKPIHTSITGFAQARKIFDLATEELKDLLSNECDVLYECKVCRNIFRSLANFISHKRVYCKEKFNSSIHSHFIKPTSITNEIIKIKQLEDGHMESLKQKDSLDKVDIDDRIPLTKDLTAIVEKITINKGIKDNSINEQHIVLQSIPKSSVAVFQSVNLQEDKECDMRLQVQELNDILSRDKAVLQSDGKFQIQSSVTTSKSLPESDNVIQISDDEDQEDTNVLKCKICELQFSTQKTLRFHMKYKHLESRLVYPCPDCLEIFSTSWSVYRHLFKVHRKTAAQIRRLRESIQSKAFRMNNPPAFYEKRKNNIKSATVQKITEEERLDRENQAWMDNMEGDGELPRCGGCGRTFERRAALAAHTNTCQPRSRALARRADTKKIEIQIRKDYNKGSASALNLPVTTTDANDNKLNSDDIESPSKTSIELPQEEEKNNELLLIEDVNKEKLKSNTPSDNGLQDQEEENNLQYNADIYLSNLPFAKQTEKNNMAAFRLKIQADIVTELYLCKKCDVKYGKIQDLYDHMANHYKWLRYACKLCNYKNYNFEKLPEHVKVVHKLKGDTEFYFSTIKAIDGTEALALCEPGTEVSDINETSPDSRRPSRCSSDSSRFSDDSTSSILRSETGARKRKMKPIKNTSKKKKEIVENDDEESDCLAEKDSLSEIESSNNSKQFEDNSSDIDEVDDKLSKKQVIEETSVAYSRPVRKRTRPKNEDFVYDLSNLLKKEAQGYRDSQSVANLKSVLIKKKIQIETPSNYEIINRDCSGALAALSKKALEKSAAHMKTLGFNVNVQKDQRSSNFFVRPMLPKISKTEKITPKEINADLKSPSKNSEQSETASRLHKGKEIIKLSTEKKSITHDDQTKAVNTDDNSFVHTNTDSMCEVVKSAGNITTVVPIKFRRQSLDVMKNPIISKNIVDFNKTGMKTKILVIKPINRNKDATQSLNKPLKFQTIKLKDPNKNNVNEEQTSDQVVVVPVPKVDCKTAHSSIVCSNNKTNVKSLNEDVNITTTDNSPEENSETTSVVMCNTLNKEESNTELEASNSEYKIIEDKSVKEMESSMNSNTET